VVMVVDGGSETSNVATVIVANKPIVVVSGVTVSSRPYSGAAIGYNASNLVLIDYTTGYEVELEVIYEWSSGLPPVDAGSYTLTVTANGGVDYVVKPQVIYFEITKAKLILSADNKTILVGSALPSFTFTVTGLVPPDTWESVRAGQSVPTVRCETANAAVVGTYQITISGGTLNDKAGANYTIDQYNNGTLTVATVVTPPSLPSSPTQQQTSMPDIPDDPEPEAEIPDIGAPLASILSFSDVNENDWFYSDVAFAFQNGLMRGTTSDVFSPNESLTRGMIVAILYRHAGSPDVSRLDNRFSDVKAGMYYIDAVKWAAKNAIVLGYGGKFTPDDFITRQDLAILLYRYAALCDMEFPAIRDYTGFVDDKDVASYSKQAVGALFAAQIINGRPGNLFDPRGNITRAETAAMLNRFHALCEAQSLQKAKNIS